MQAAHQKTGGRSSEMGCAVPSKPGACNTLGSWKEIASYLGKGVRTVQRWEREFGLPIRRPPQHLRRMVCASPEELDDWLAHSWRQNNGASSPAAAEAVSPMNGNGAHLTDLQANIYQAHKLRSASRQLVQELAEQVQTAIRTCASLSCGAFATKRRDEDRLS